MEKHLNLIKKIAWSFHSFHHSTGVEWDDLLQEAAVAYFESLETYDKDKGQVTTYVWHCITNRLTNYLKEQEKYKAHIHEEELYHIDEIELTRHPAQIASEFWESLTEEAKVIANMILFTPRKYTCLTSAEAKGRITRIMTKNGWEKEKINAAINCLKLACQ
jgi:RNA polymerase sigma factor (sigma-70 family)